MISQRDVFFDKLFELAKENPDIYLVSADMGAPSLDKFRKDLSRQYIDAGIAEQNALTVAAGLAKEGKKAFVYAIAPFVSYRIVEQIRLDLCAMKLPVSVVGVGSGFSYDDSGPTHHTTEDISMLRCLPNLLIHNITDPAMAEAVVEKSIDLDLPNYIRLDRKVSANIYKENLKDYLDLNVGFSVKSNTVNPDYWIVTTGNMIFNIQDFFKDKRFGVIDVFQFPVKDNFCEAIKGCKKIITIEEHVLPGGLGSAVLEVLADNDIQVPVKRFGVDYSDGFCYQYGGRQEIQKKYGLDRESLKGEILGWI